MGGVMVTGGAGYVGSHVVRRLVEDGERVVVLDDLSEGHRAALGEVPLAEGDIGDFDRVRDVLDRFAIDRVVHMAAVCLVGESVEDPGKYYDVNVARSIRLLDAAVAHGVRSFVFSSTAAVYGEPERVPIDEDHPTHPTNTYGETKLAIERALEWYRRAHGMAYATFRYFNAAGAHPDGSLGEHHAPETHLLPNLLRAARDGAPPARIFGTDYPTPDGTCVRDYVHVVDLAEAHVAALGVLSGGGHGAPAGRLYNLGNGSGFSVREVVDAVERVTGASLEVVEEGRRAGDPATLVASSGRAREELDWRPRYDTLESIVETAWRWHRDHPLGYEAAS